MAFASWEKIIKVGSVVVAVAVAVAAREEVAAVVVATMVVVLVSPVATYATSCPSATVLIHFVLKLIFPEYKKTKKFLTRKLLVREPFSFYQKV